MGRKRRVWLETLFFFFLFFRDGGEDDVATSSFVSSSLLALVCDSSPVLASSVTEEAAAVVFVVVVAIFQACSLASDLWENPENGDWNGTSSPRCGPQGKYRRPTAVLV